MIQRYQFQTTERYNCLVLYDEIYSRDSNADLYGDLGAGEA